MVAAPRARNIHFEKVDYGGELILRKNSIRMLLSENFVYYEENAVSFAFHVDLLSVAL